MADNKKKLKALCKCLYELNSSKKIEEFLVGILTPKELAEIPTRLEIIRLLKAGVPQREIADKLGVGIATITRGARELKSGKFSDL